MNNFRYPNITGRSEKEQLAQIKSYLHQLVDQLNYVHQNDGGQTSPGQVDDQAAQAWASAKEEFESWQN